MLKSFPIFKDQRGTLVPIDFNKLAFTPKRMFYIKNVPKTEERGGHAHYNTKQVLVCIKGEVEITLDKGYSSTKVTLKENESVFVDSLIWDSQVYKTGHDILMSICSTDHNELDYIRDYKKFLETIGYEKKS